MRLFAALPLPETARAPLAEAADALRQDGWPVRWVDAPLMHLTLKFYGDVTDERAAAIADALAGATDGVGAVLLEIAGLGTLPGGRAARVIVANVEPAPALELLQHRVERASEAVGVPVEGRPFRPHVTLGRVRQGERLPAAARAKLARRAVAAAGLAERVELYESRAGAGGPRYVAHRSYGLVA